MSRSIYLSIGSNLSKREENLERAIVLLKEQRIDVMMRSSIYETEPWGVKEQPYFLNIAIEVSTALEPLELLGILKGIEKSMGRQNTSRYGPRIIDLDIIFYNYMVIDIPELIIPHPLMHERRFVLEPLAEIAPQFRHPLFGLTVKELMDRCIYGNK